MATLAFPYLSDFVRALTGVDLPLPLPMFGLMVATAFVAALAVARAEVGRLHAAGRIGMARRRSRQDGGQVDAFVPPQQVISDLGVVALLAGLVGARLFHIFEHPHEFMAAPLSMIFSRSGFTIFGGLIFGTLAGVAFLRRAGLSIAAVCDAAAPAMMLGYAVGRLGCQLSGDGDWGIAANMALKPDWLPAWLWAQTYDNNIIGMTIAPPGVYPTPIYEFLMGMLCFGILWAFRKHPFRAGWLFSLYLVLAGAERFLIEQIRVNPVVSVLGFQASQAEIIAAALMVLGALGLVVLGARRASA